MNLRIFRCGECQDGKVVKELLIQKFPYLKKYNIKCYSVDERNDWIYIRGNGVNGAGVTNDSLYCPISALFEKDAAKIINTHLTYWHSYGNGKYDKREEDFVNSDTIKAFLADVVA